MVRIREGGSLTRPSDEELVDRSNRALDGDYAAFEALVERYKAKVLANCRYITRSDDAEDLAQEVFLKVFFALRRFEGRARFSTWIQRIKINHCLNYLKKHQRYRTAELEDEHGVERPELRVEGEADRHVEKHEMRERIGATLEALPETLRVPLVLRDADGLSYREVADSLGIGLSAAKMRIKRGRAEFRRLYQRRLDEGAGVSG